MSWLPAVTTYRDGKNGLWLAKAGKSAKSAAERDLLIATDYRNFSFMVNGVADLPVGRTLTVLYGSVLANRPVPVTQIIYKRSNQSMVPVYQLISGATPDSFLVEKSEEDYGQYSGPFGTVTANSNSLVFLNRKKIGYKVRFLVTSVQGV